MSAPCPNAPHGRGGVCPHRVYPGSARDGGPKGHASWCRLGARCPLQAPAP